MKLSILCILPEVFFPIFGNFSLLQNLPPPILGQIGLSRCEISPLFFLWHFLLQSSSHRFNNQLFYLICGQYTPAAKPLKTAAAPFSLTCMPISSGSICLCGHAVKQIKELIQLKNKNGGRGKRWKGTWTNSSI